MIVYIENLHFPFVLKTILKIRKNYDYKVFYFDSSIISDLLLKLIKSKIKLKIEKLDFKMMDIKDENNEIIRARIPRKDLFFIKDKIINHEAYKTSLVKDNNYEKFIQKGLINVHIQDQTSISRILYIINVVDWHNKKNHFIGTKLIINQTPWFEIIYNYANKFSIELIKGKGSRKNIISTIKEFIFRIIKGNTNIYIFLDNLINRKTKRSKSDLQKMPLLYLEGRGDVNLDNDGNHSDFFWVMNSNFPPRNILYDHHSEQEKNILNKFGIKLNENKINYFTNNNIIQNIKINESYKTESKELFKFAMEYKSLHSYWYSFFNSNNVKLFLTWYKYSRNHIAIADAMEDYGGISAIWQMAFDGEKQIGSRTVADIVFSFSRYFTTLESEINSKIKYNIITGYPKDYAKSKLRSQSRELRNKLNEVGAKKIIFSIDENSIDDSRWHTGHELQRENYSYICEKLLEISWLGVIFKPKNAKTLRARLGPVNDILVAAEKTGRCLVLEESGRHTTLASPLLAALASDICIHGHLDSGTAALECALAGMPTLLINREGNKKHKLNELPDNLIVHNNWPEALKITIDHLKISDGIPGFGDWSEFLDEYDPFRDGQAANRMGSYLQRMLKGFESGLDRDTIMDNVAECYADEWGYDKVVTA